MSDFDMFQIEPSDHLNHALALHWARTGHFEVARSFIDETQLSIEPTLLSKFSELHLISQAMKKKNFKPAISWASTQSELLLARGSDLEFVLHKAQFIQILFDTGPSLALVYARQHLSRCGQQYLTGKNH